MALVVGSEIDRPTAMAACAQPCDSDGRRGMKAGQSRRSTRAVCSETAFHGLTEFQLSRCSVTRRPAPPAGAVPFQSASWQRAAADEDASSWLSVNEPRRHNWQKMMTMATRSVVVGAGSCRLASINCAASAAVVGEISQAQLVPSRAGSLVAALSVCDRLLAKGLGVVLVGEDAVVGSSARRAVASRSEDPLAHALVRVKRCPFLRKTCQHQNGGDQADPTAFSAAAEGIGKTVRYDNAVADRSAV
jgi:hypothetical protein